MCTQKVLSRTMSCKISFSRANINTDSIFRPHSETERSNFWLRCARESPVFPVAATNLTFLCLQGIFPVSYVHLKKSTVTNRG